MKKFFFGIALSLLMPTLFSFSGINSSSVTPRSTVKPIFFSNEKPKKGKKDKKDKAKFECLYYFKVLNNVLVAAECTDIVLQKTIPSTTPPSNTVCDGVQTYWCYLGYPSFVIINGEYFPSINGVTPVSPCDYECPFYRSSTI